MPDLLSKDTESSLRLALQKMMRDVTNPNDPEDVEHILRTPERVVKAYAELLSGVHQDPENLLRTSFAASSCDEMVTVETIDFVSVCIHHLLPFYGQAYFAYIPKGRIVGLSKIPRMVDILAHRPQVQERLTNQIADLFQKVVEPLGCGVVIRAWHGCVACRGVLKPNIRMRTTALRGVFADKAGVKEEFLAGVNHS